MVVRGVLVGALNCGCYGVNRGRQTRTVLGPWGCPSLQQPLSSAVHQSVFWCLTMRKGEKLVKKVKIFTLSPDCPNCSHFSGSQFAYYQLLEPFPSPIDGSLPALLCSGTFALFLGCGLLCLLSWTVGAPGRHHRAHRAHDANRDRVTGITAQASLQHLFLAGRM